MSACVSRESCIFCVKYQTELSGFEYVGFYIKVNFPHIALNHLVRVNLTVYRKLTQQPTRERYITNYKYHLIINLIGFTHVM